MDIKKSEKDCADLAITTINRKETSEIPCSAVVFHVYSEIGQLEALSNTSADLKEWIASEIAGKALDNVLFIENKKRQYFVKLAASSGSLLCQRQGIRKVVDQILSTAESIKSENIQINYLSSKDTTIAWTLYYVRYLAFKYTKKNSKTPNILKSVQVITDFSICKKEEEFVNELMRAKNEARELLNMRADEFTPFFITDYAESFAKEFGLKFRAFRDQELITEGLRIVHAVGRGSSNKPSLFAIEYFGDKVTGSQELASPIVALIGKGITFDDGGVNIKPTGFVEEMFSDKGGACATFAAFKAAVRLGLKKNVVLVLPFAENKCGGNSYRPSDIIKSHKGLTVEITNTDAEGRLVLADAMSWAQTHYKVDTLIEMSTLTGACVVSLKDLYAGLFTNDDELGLKLKKNAEIYGEDMWQLPLSEEVKNGLAGGVSDLVNSTLNRYGGAIEAAEFLHHFVDEKVKWVHLDIAGMALDKNIKYHKANKAVASGFGVSTLLAFLSK
jgi:leucyl aminopeptidase